MITLKRSRELLFGAFFVAGIFAWLVVDDLSRPAVLEVDFFSVGQGDAIFIETPDRQQVLIDGGPDAVILEKLAKVMPFWDRTIDWVILTHPEKDHLSGLLDVLKRYQVKNILWTGLVRNTAEYQAWVDLIKKEGAKIFIAKAGQKLGPLTILSPRESQEGKVMKDSNNASIVARLDYGSDSFLFTGDIAKSAEKKLSNVDVDVLKVAHHGSKNSTSETFIKAVSPEIAVIEVGKDNSYGHPTQAVLDILQKYDIKVFRTDFDGDIKIISDGKNYGISTLQN